MLVCSHCGDESPERFRFCGSCGRPLADPVSAGEERKTVSVLFVDLVGFTARSDRADPEDVRARLRPYHARVREVIQRFGGTVEKFVGDAVMAAFGAPIVREDDAERAVRAALRILDAIEELNQEEPGIDLLIRAGINTGEAVVAIGARPAEGEGFVTGDVVNTAARLQGAAPSGAVVVGETTYRVTREHILYEPLDPVTVKGKSEPLPLWRAVRARSHLGIDLDAGSSAPLVGRGDELEVLRRTYLRALREGRPQLVTIMGEPGIGKSRLLSEFRNWVDERAELVFWRQGRCLPYGEGIMFWALGEILKAQAGILESDSAETASSKLAAMVNATVPEESAHSWIGSQLGPLIGAKPDQAADREQTFAAWLRFLECLATQRPLLLILEDLHWADGALLDFVEHLIDFAAESPLLIICTGRPELYERRPGWGGGKRNSTTVALSALSHEDTARLLGVLLGRAVLPAETQAALLERASGNPLFAEEFVRMLEDRGLFDAAGRLDAGGTSALELPETVSALIAARIDTLQRDRKDLLQHASVVGKVFWVGAVAAIGDVAPDMVRQGMRELIRKELIRPVRTASVAGQEEFTFWHALVRDVAYGQIPRRERAQRHRLAALWLESVAGDRIADHAAVVATHWLEALELTRAAGSDGPASELSQQAARFLALAGLRASALDTSRAIDYYSSALDLLVPSDPGRPQLLVDLARALAIAARATEALPLLAEAAAAFRDSGDTSSAAQALLQLSLVHRNTGETERAQQLIAEAALLLDENASPAALVALCRARSGDAMMSGRTRAMLEQAEEGLRLFEQGSVPERESVPLLQYRGAARCELGDLEGLDDLRRSIVVAKQAGYAAGASVGYVNLGNWLWFIEGPAAALANHRAGIDFAVEHGLAGGAHWLRAESLWMLYDLGEWDDLLVESARALEFSDQDGSMGHPGALMAAQYRAFVLIQRGGLLEAESLVRGYLPLARETKDKQILVPGLTIAALLKQAQARGDEALALVEEVEAATRGTAPFHRARCVAETVRIAAGAGALSLAERLVDGIFASAPRERYALLGANATLAASRGETQPALQQFEEAAARWAEFGNAPEHAYSLVGAASCLLRLGDHEAASERLQPARQIFTRLKARTPLGQFEAFGHPSLATGS